jgi:hypothetical protein
MDCFVALLLAMTVNHQEPPASPTHLSASSNAGRRVQMGRYLLLWLLGVPLPILILIYAFGGLNH